MSAEDLPTDFSRINALACYEEQRGKGIAQALLTDSYRRGAEQGCSSASLIVASENQRAKKLYDFLGYQLVSRLAVIEYPGCLHGGDWLLMTRAI